MGRRAQALSSTKLSKSKLIVARVSNPLIFMSNMAKLTVRNHKCCAIIGKEMRSSQIYAIDLLLPLPDWHPEFSLL
jgi:hypothetical protein